MVELSGVLDGRDSNKIMVVGDLMLDAYTIGHVHRISPEAPVPVLHVSREERRAGGSGNVVLNLRALGARVITVGRVGADVPGRCLRDALEKGEEEATGIVCQRDFPTPVKNRIIASSQQLLRVDHEDVSPLPSATEAKVVEALPYLLEDVQVVAVSDYGKGFVTPTLMAALMGMTKQRGIPVISDPKGLDFSKYVGSTILKPNQSEALAAAGLARGESVDLAADILLRRYAVDTLMITRSGEGISLYPSQGAPSHFPVHTREVVDVTGAGDTVLAALAFSLAAGLDLSQATMLANVAAGIAVQSLGCAQVSRAQLRERLTQLVG